MPLTDKLFTIPTLALAAVLENYLCTIKRNNLKNPIGLHHCSKKVLGSNPGEAVVGFFIINCDVAEGGFGTPPLD